MPWMYHKAVSLLQVDCKGPLQQYWVHCVTSPSTGMLVDAADMCLTVVSQKGLGRALRVRAGGLCASPAVETDATVGATVTLTPYSYVASIYTSLQAQKAQRFLQFSPKNPVSSIMQCLSAEIQGLTVSVCAPMDSNRAESWTILSIAP